jgi:type I restriction enzyme S subunit
LVAKPATGRSQSPREGLPPYLAYKDSGTGWLGKIPAHWEVCRLKTIAAVDLSNVDKKSVDGQTPVMLCNYLDVYKNERINGAMEFMAATATPAQVRRFSLRAGDVLITKDSESWNDIAVPSVVVEELPEVLCGYHLALVRPRSDRSHGPFLARAFSAAGLRDQFHVAANGITRFGLGGDAIRTGLFPMPPVEEQRAISEFLDRETARIDGLVAKKEQLIDLLQEKRTTLITRAVTKGLDSSVPLKESGVEWLGQIPAHWQVTTIKRLWHRCDYGVSESLDGYGDIRVLTMTHVQDGEIVPPSDGCLPEVPPDLILDHHDLLFNRTNSRDLVAKVGIFRGNRSDNISFASYLVRMRFGKGTDPEYLNYVLNSPGVLSRARSVSLLSVNQANLNPTRYGELIIGLPPFDEQLQIRLALDAEMKRIASLGTAIRQAIVRLKELRSALISAAVTGKIDVGSA